jgi:probable rRNA maturation factor
MMNDNDTDDLGSEPISIDIAEEYIDAVDADALRSAIQATLHQAGRDEAELTLVITDDAEIRELNRTYRGIDTPTDVLSFVAFDTVAADAPRLVIADDAAVDLANYLGDIVIAYPYSERQARRFNNSILSELRLLAVHGTLHLLGYDHDTPEQEADMWALQDQILIELGERGLSRRDFDE